MGTLRTVIGIWFQFWGAIGIILGMAILIFGVGILSIPTLDVIATLPLTTSVVVPPDLIEANQFGGCISGYVFNPDLSLCQRIGSSLSTLQPPSSGSLDSLLGFNGLIFLGTGIISAIIGTIIRGK